MDTTHLHPRNQGRWQLRVAAVVASALFLGLPAHADLVENRLEGEVIVIIADGSVKDELADLGVKTGKRVIVALEVDDEAVGTDEVSGRVYQTAIANWTVSIGQFRATFNPGAFDFVNVANDRSGVDKYGADASMDSTDDVLGASPSARLRLSGDIDTIADEGAVQDLNRFTVGEIAVSGRDGTLRIVFFQTPPPASKCVRRQTSSAAEYCRAVLRCLAEHAKDQNDAGLIDCLENADAEFTVNFDEAADGGGFCSSSVDGAGAVEALAGDVDPLDMLVNQNADPDSEADKTYRSKILKAASNSVDTALSAYAKDGKKPKPKKLKKKLKSNKKKLKKQVKKAGAKAAKAGITPDVSGSDVANEVDQLVDSVLGVVNGP